MSPERRPASCAAPPGETPAGLSEDLSEPPESQTKPLSPSRTKTAEFVLHVRRPIAQEFRIICKIFVGEKEKKIETEARIPKALSISAEALSCIVRGGAGAPGRIWDIRLSKGGKLLAAFDGSAKYVLLRSPGPWGRAVAKKVSKPRL